LIKKGDEMKLRLLMVGMVSLLLSMVYTASDAAEKPKIREAVRMDGANAINVNTTAKSDQSYWIGCSVRYKDGKVKDLEAQKAKGSQTVMFFVKRVSYEEFIVKLWKKKFRCSRSKEIRGHSCSNQEKKMGYFMHGEIDSTGWQAVGYNW
jgi:hypothetical protein